MVVVVVLAWRCDIRIHTSDCQTQLWITIFNLEERVSEKKEKKKDDGQGQWVRGRKKLKTDERILVLPRRRCCL